MTTRYVYSTVQIIPRLSAGEAINFAVIAGCDQTGDWAIRPVRDTNRARRFCGIDAMTAAHDFLDHLEERRDVLESQGNDLLAIDPAEARAEALSEQLVAEMATLTRGVVQLTAPMPVIAETAEEALDLIVPEVLIEPQPRRFRRLTKKRLVSEVRESYMLSGVPDDAVRQRPRLLVGADRQFHFNTDFAVGTDHVVQLCSAWSFQIVDLDLLARDVQAWGWNLRELRDHGGVVDGAPEVEVPRAVDVQVLIAPDPEDAADKALNDARYVFDEVNATLVTFGDEASIADAAAKLLPVSA